MTNGTKPARALAALIVIIWAILSDCEVGLDDTGGEISVTVTPPHL